MRQFVVLLAGVRVETQEPLIQDYVPAGDERLTPDVEINHG